MARRYQIDELLWLRSSPLVVKPPSLPPTEEWMGPTPDPAFQQRKPITSRDSNEPMPRRPSLFETRHISRGSNSEDIILGPPKTAFASASRIPGKSSIDSTGRSSRPLDSEETTKNDRYTSRDKVLKDKDTGDKDFERRDTRSGAINGRRGEREDWNNGRPRRTFGGEDQHDRKIKRHGDSGRWEGKEQERDGQSGEYTSQERVTKDKDGHFTIRRDVVRSRHETSWFRSENNNNLDSTDADEERPSARNKEWRRDRISSDRDWNRGIKIEQDPEWLDVNDRDEGRRVHTQEDFERWKERMKSGSTQTPAEEKKVVTAEPVVSTPQKSDGQPNEGDIFANQSTPLHDDSMEKFFGLLGTSKPAQVAGAPAPVTTATKEMPPVKGVKPSRFAGLFSPPLENTMKELESPPATQALPKNEHDADQEGFQRILQMLGGGGKSHNVNLQEEPSQQRRPPPLVQPEQTRTATALSSPSRDSFNRQELVGSRRSAESPLTENVLSPSPLKDSQARDRERLLRLMQQVNLTPASQTGRGGHAQVELGGQTSGILNILNIPEGLSRLPPGLSVQKTPNFLDNENPAIANMQQAEAISGDHGRRVAGPPMGYFDEMPFTQAAQIPITPSGNRIPQGQVHPAIGLQRPPGFDHLPPPGWSGHELPPQTVGGPNSLGPPPGISTPNHRGINSSYMNIPMGGTMPPMNECQHLPRSTGAESAGFGPPPGMMPPPGYMNMNPLLSSGFRPMHPNVDGVMGLGHGAQGPFGGVSAGPQGPTPSSRHLLDMFGQANSSDARGGMIGAGHYR